LDPNKRSVNGWRVHDGSKPSDPVVLAPLYLPGSKYKPGLIKFLKPTYDIMNRIYLNTIAVKGGNFDAIHSFHIDLMLHTYLHKDDVTALDVMDVLWNDIWLTLLDRQSASYGPYIMLLILDTWAKANNGEDLLDLIDPADITTHRVRRLRVKDHNPEDPNEPDPILPDMPDVDEDADSEADPDYDPTAEPMVTRSVEEPSWLKKMMGKFKKSFFLKLHLQDRMYEEHVNAKKDRQR